MQRIVDRAGFQIAQFKKGPRFKDQWYCLLQKTPLPAWLRRTVGDDKWLRFQNGIRGFRLPWQENSSLPSSIISVTSTRSYVILTEAGLRDAVALYQKRAARLPPMAAIQTSEGESTTEQGMLHYRLAFSITQNR
jgi:hypothetical protein